MHRSIPALDEIDQLLHFVSEKRLVVQLNGVFLNAHVKHNLFLRFDTFW